MKILFVITLMLLGISVEASPCEKASELKYFVTGKVELGYVMQTPNMDLMPHALLKSDRPLKWNDISSLRLRKVGKVSREWIGLNDSFSTPLDVWEVCS